MIELSGVSKKFGDRTVLERLDLSIPKGQTTVLIGPSGCGKSTLLRLMIGLIVPDTGSVSIGGRDLTASSVLEIRRGVGYVIQDGGLFPHLDARENVTIMPRFLGWDDLRIESRLSELVSLTRFPKEGLDRFPHHLSGGQRQRLGLIRALMLDPDLILLDEPLGALDPMVRAELQMDLKHIFQSLGKTVVLVTHDLAEAAWFGDEILLMRDGRLIQRGGYSALLETPSDPFVTRFVQAHLQIQSLMPGVRP